MEIDPDLIISDARKPWIQAVAPLGKGGRGFMWYYRAVLREISHIHNIDLTKPFKDLNKNTQDLILHGSGDEIWGRQFEGVVGYFERTFYEVENDVLKDEISRFMSILPCPECQGRSEERRVG